MQIWGFSDVFRPPDLQVPKKTSLSTDPDPSSNCDHGVVDNTIPTIPISSMGRTVVYLPTFTHKNKPFM